mgnify:CR=1 FL=1
MVRILTSSDRSLCVEFGNAISEDINNMVNAYALALERAAVHGVTELVPTYRSVTVHYRPEVIRYEELYSILLKIAKQTTTVQMPEREEIRVPVLYGGEFGPDLSQVAKLHGLSEQEVISLHCKPSYLIYMMGFLPGFCYLGGLDERLATPRLTVPRVKIPAGSVGIADRQTGIYPLESPGGWQLIGRTPLKLYDPNRKDPILFRAGMRLRYYPVDRSEFDRIWSLEHPDEPAP